MVLYLLFLAERCVLHGQQHRLLCLDFPCHQEQRRASRDGFLPLHVRIRHQPCHPVRHAAGCLRTGRHRRSMAHRGYRLCHYRSDRQHALCFFRQGTAGGRVGRYLG